MKGTLVVVACLTAPALGTVQFLATDGTHLIRADSTGSVQPAVTMSQPLQSLTFVPWGSALPGASGGDVIACRAGSVSGQWGVYRMDDPFGASPTLTQIGSTTFGVGSLVFAGSELYGINDSLAPMRVSQLDPTNFSVIQTWNTGINVAGGGGLAWDSVGSRFIISDATNHRLMAWTPAGGASVIGPVGLGFANNGIEFLEGTLYGALRPDASTTTLRMGAFDLSTGAFTTMATATGITGAGTGFVAIPAPGALAALAMGGMLSWRRRR